MDSGDNKVENTQMSDLSPERETGVRWVHSTRNFIAISAKVHSLIPGLSNSLKESTTKTEKVRDPRKVTGCREFALVDALSET